MQANMMLQQQVGPPIIPPEHCTPPHNIPPEHCTPPHNIPMSHLTPPHNTQPPYLISPSKHLTPPHPVSHHVVNKLLSNITSPDTPLEHKPPHLDLLLPPPGLTFEKKGKSLLEPWYQDCRDNCSWRE